MPTPVPTDETERLAALHSYRVLDAGPTAALADVARLAAHICDTPLGAVTLVDTDRLWVAAGHGTAAQDLARDAGVCAYTIVERDVTVIPDALRDERFVGNPLVVHPPHIRFYAGAALIDADGHALGSVCAMDLRPREITAGQADSLRGLARQVIAQFELRRAQSDLANAEAHLRGAARFKDDFVALISHEVRTPMTAIQGYVNLLLDDLTANQPRGGLGTTQPRTDHHDQLAAGIEENCRRLRRLIDQLLLISTAEHGSVALELSVTELGAIADRAVAAGRDRAGRAGVTLTSRAGRAVRVLADESRLAEALDQLVTNAVTFTPEGGTVEVRVDDADRPTLVVDDTGVGIPRDELRLVFDRFYRGAHAARVVAPGAGLGLSVARTIVEAHGGRLELVSLPGTGTTASICLPPGIRRP